MTRDLKKRLTSESHLNSLLRSNLTPWLIHRFEPGIPVGMPDIHWLAPTGESGWIESKFEVEHVRAEQAIWLRNYSQGGGRAHVVAVKGGDLYSIPGRLLPIDRRIPWAHPLMRHHGPASTVDWVRFTSLLLRDL